MSYAFNPFTGNLDIKGSGGASQPTTGKLAYYLAALAAYDRVAEVTYLDQGLRTMRAGSVTYSSAAFPSADLVKTISYLDVGTLNQRIQKIEYVGAVFTPQSLRKVFSYSLYGIRYRLDEYNYELF